MQNLVSKEMLMVITAIVPSFAIAFIGYLLGRWDRSVHQKTVSNLIYYLFSPCLIFSSLHKRAFDLREFTIIGAAVLFLIAAMLPLAAFFKKRAGVRERGYYLPIIFMSTGTLSLPISLLLYGSEGLAKAVMFHMVNILVLYSFGGYLVSGSASLLQILKIPALTATVLGIADSQLPFTNGIGELSQLLVMLERIVEVVGFGAIPLLILSFGYSLNESNPSDMKDGITGGLLKIVGGPALAFVLIYLLRATGIMPVAQGMDVLKHLDFRTTEAVIILNAAMPGPIMAYLLNVKFDNCPQKAAAMLTMGTLGGILTIPLVLQLINLFIFK
jgi:predicted permease